MSSVSFLGPQNASKSLVVGASLQTPQGDLQHSPDLLVGLRGLTSKRGEERERQNNLCPRRKKPSPRTD